MLDSETDSKTRDRFNHKQKKQQVINLTPARLNLTKSIITANYKRLNRSNTPHRLRAASLPDAGATAGELCCPIVGTLDP